jgi:hypothetical protein
MLNLKTMLNMKNSQRLKITIVCGSVMHFDQFCVFFNFTSVSTLHLMVVDVELKMGC